MADIRHFDDVDSYLPIGSIVKIRGFLREFMIIGRFYETDKIKKDYCGVLYPEGFISTQATIMFNHKDIEEVVVRAEESDRGKVVNAMLKAVQAGDLKGKVQQES